MTDVVTVRVPASSANLGPGFDTFAAALGLWFELEVVPAERFELVTDLDLPRDRGNLVVRAFERLHPADGLRFSLRSEIPLSGGLGSSAAGVVAGLLAAERVLRDAGLRSTLALASDGDGGLRSTLALASEIEGHPDNAAAALLGGIVICTEEGEPHRFEAPAGLSGVLVIPHEPVPTARARAALPASVPLADAVHNTAHGALLMVGLATGDLELVARGLRDRLHQPRRAHLYPRSAALLERAPEIGALGATISGAGPTVLVWAPAPRAAEIAAALSDEAGGWADVLPAAFSGAGATVA